MNQPKATNIVWHQGLVDHAERCSLLGQRGATLWMTGLSGSGKSTVACALEQTLLKAGTKAYRLDGDNIRHGLNRDLGFAASDRTENIRRIGEVARLFTDACTITICSFISPYCSDRAAVRALHEKYNLPFLECFLNVPLDVAESRDPKGLYVKARKGEIKGFTGIDDPYEAPESPEITLPTHEQSVEDSVKQIIGYLQQNDYIR